MKPSTDPLIQKLRLMCTKDKIVQALYHNKISWSDVPSDDDVLELDDWKSYEKMEARAKEAYQHHVAAQRSKTKKNSQISSQPTRKHRVLPAIPAILPAILPVIPATLPVIPAISAIPAVPAIPVVKKEIVENHNVYQSPIEYEEMDVVPSTEITEQPVTEKPVTDLNELTEHTEVTPYQPDTEGSDKGSSLRYYVFLLIILIYVMMHKES